MSTPIPCPIFLSTTSNLNEAQSENHALLHISDREAIQHSLAICEGQALDGNGLYALTFAEGRQIIQILLTTGLPSPGIVDISRNGSIAGVNGNGVHPRGGSMPTIEEICQHVEQALKDYRFTSRLGSNPLAKWIDLEALLDKTIDNQMQARGMALRQALDKAIDAIAGSEQRNGKRLSLWRLENYLHLRYREDYEHKIIAARVGYTERHMQRLRKELIEDVAHLLLAGFDHSPAA